MAKEKTSAEKLAALSKSLKSGASILHPVTDKELEAVRDAVKEQTRDKTAEKDREQERDRDH